MKVAIRTADNEGRFLDDCSGPLLTQPSPGPATAGRVGRAASDRIRGPRPSRQPRRCETQRPSAPSSAVDACLRANDLGLSCASNMAAPRSEVQAEQCGPTRLPRQLQTFVRVLTRRRHVGVDSRSSARRLGLRRIRTGIALHSLGRGCLSCCGSRLRDRTSDRRLRVLPGRRSRSPPIR